MACTRSKASAGQCFSVSEGFEPPLDFTFMCIATCSDCLEEEPRNQAKTSKPKDSRKSRTNAIRLNNNVLADWTGFCSTIEKLVENPLDIEWIDLSFNDLSGIDKCILQFPKLKVLYLHGNSIEKIGEVEKLNQLEHLKSLTLHGNPVEHTKKGYRQYVVSKLPLLKNFDFSCVTKSDRACSKTWSEMHKLKSKKNY